MQCPECGSSQIHRSRRKGSFERDFLTPLAIYPFRCSDCQARFKRFQPDQLPKNLTVLMSDPPKWIRAIAWFVFIVVAAIFIGFMVGRLRK